MYLAQGHFYMTARQQMKILTYRISNSLNKTFHLQTYQQLMSLRGTLKIAK